MSTVAVVGNPKPHSRTLAADLPGRGPYVVDAQPDDMAAYADWLAVTRPIVDRYLRGRAA
jgi:FMN reductase